MNRWTYRAINITVHTASASRGENYLHTATLYSESKNVYSVRRGAIHVSASNEERENEL